LGPTLPPRSRKTAKATGKTRVLLFSGRPLRVQALVPVPADALTGATVTLELESGPAQVPTLAMAAAPGYSTVRLVPAEPLPAGTFTGRLTAAAAAWDAEVEVLGQPRARAYPRRLELSTAGETEVTVDLINIGNVEAQVARSYAIPLEKQGILRRALVAGIQSEQGGVERWGAAADSIAASQAGVARLAVREGAGRLAPGQAQRVSGALTIPEDLQPGATYIGTWQLPGTSVPIRVTPPGERPRPRPRRSASG
jgi:hypothetical protein